MAPVEVFDEPEPGDEQPTHDLYGDDVLRKPGRGRRPAAAGRARKAAAPKTAVKTAAAPRGRKRAPSRAK